MSDTLNKKHSPAAVIMKRELAAYFTSPVAYIVTALFLIIAGITLGIPFIPSSTNGLKESDDILMSVSVRIEIVVKNCRLQVQA